MAGASLRVWVDVTEASQVVFMAPIVRRLEGSGHTVTLTARRFAEADLVLRRYGLPAVLTTGHRGGGLGTRAVGLANRTARLLALAAGERFDVAVGSHASDLAGATWALGIPTMTFLDDEHLHRGNTLNMRLVDEVAAPDAVSPATLTTYGAPSDRLFRYPGFKEEYYLHDLSADPGALAGLGVDGRRLVGVVRPGRAAAGAESRREEAALLGITRELATHPDLTLIVVARDEAQRRAFLEIDGSALLAPATPLTGAASLIAAADFILGAGGVMTREAAALGVPAYTVSWRPATPVDASLLASGRLRRVATAAEIAPVKQDARTAPAYTRDPVIFVNRLLELARRRSRRARLADLVRGLRQTTPFD